MLLTVEVNEKYKALLAACRTIFLGKGMEYGPTWAAFRNISLCDQLWIKAKRIRSLEEKENMVKESIEGEYMALINYSIIFLMRLKNPDFYAKDDSLLQDIAAISSHAISAAYDESAQMAFDLYVAKNHDYNNAWQEMNLMSITDMIIIKILRMRHIILAKGDSLTPPDIDGQLFDTINYSIFALILLEERARQKP